MFRRADHGPRTTTRPLLHPRGRRESEQRPWHIFRDPTLHIFAVCTVLFHFSNAAMLPLALNELSKRVGASGFVVSAAIIVPQVVVAACSPWAGRLAQSIGRKPVLLFGFAALPLRGLLFVASPDAIPLVVIQVLDGVSATVFGLIMPLIAADLTQRTGYLNLAIGALAWPQVSAPPSARRPPDGLPTQSGRRPPSSASHWSGLPRCATVWRMMPETRPGRPFTGRPAVAAV